MANGNDTQRGEGTKPPGFSAGTAEAGPKRFPWKTAVTVLAVVAVVAFVVRQRGRAAPEGKAGPGARGGVAPVSVVAGAVAEQDVSIDRDGLGTGQAFNTVAVRSRVDGQLQKLFFKEGQDVRAGDALAQIDAAPFQAQVAQAEAKKAQDEAQLSLARTELKRNADLLA